MNVVVWLPYRETPDRAPLYDAVRAQIDRLDLPVIVADSGDEPFSWARSCNLAATMSRDWKYAIKWGADFLLSPAEPYEAVDRALGLLDDPSTSVEMVYLFDRYTRMTKWSTRQHLTHRDYAVLDSKLPPGGPNIITRRLWDDIGGYDPRFVGWGHEDRVYMHSISTLGYTTSRVPGRCFNLWHPRRRDTPDADYFQYQERNHRMYLDFKAITDPDDLRAEIRRIRHEYE